MEYKAPYKYRPLLSKENLDSNYVDTLSKKCYYFYSLSLTDEEKIYTEIQDS